MWLTGQALYGNGGHISALSCQRITHQSVVAESAFVTLNTMPLLLQGQCDYEVEDNAIVILKWRKKTAEEIYGLLV